MKKLQLLTLISAFIFGSINAFASNPQTPKMGFFELQKIMERIPEFKLAEKKLKNAYETEQKKFEIKMREFQETYNQFRNADPKVISEKARNNLQKKLEKLQEELKMMQQDSQTIGFKLKEKYIKPVMEDLSKVAAKMCNDLGYDVLKKVEDESNIYINPKFMCTDELVARLKKFYKNKK